MKGLLLKDWYMMKRYCRTYLLIAVLFTAISVADSDNMFFSFYPCLLCGMIPVTLLGYDERSRWLLYSATLPYTRKQIVSSKYLIGICTQLAVLLLTGASQGIKMAVNGTFEASDFLMMMLTILTISSIASSISLPFIFKYGVEKGRTAYYVMIGFVCASSIVATRLFDPQSHLSLKSGAVLVLPVLFGIGVYVLSWYLSVIFYGRREL